jgi:hypothetical protein
VTSVYFPSTGTLNCGAMPFRGGVQSLWNLGYKVEAPGVSSTTSAIGGPFGFLCAMVVGAPTFGGAIFLCI